MNVFRERFRRPHVVLPVIHVFSERQALRNASIAHDAGADGIFLINHSISSKELIEIHTALSGVFADWWIGVNCLDLNPETTFAHIRAQVDGVWVDNALIQECQTQQPAAEKALESQRRYGWKGLYFGGVAFKYQRQVSDLRMAAAIARSYMDVVTTSGPGTGKAAHVEKIRTMKEALGDCPLAIASGITPANVCDYLPYSDCYLVATGLSKNFEELDYQLATRLVETVRSYDEVNRSGLEVRGSNRA
jgi:predicted TIM-barrel enzyme